MPDQVFEHVECAGRERQDGTRLVGQAACTGLEAEPAESIDYGRGRISICVQAHSPIDPGREGYGVALHDSRSPLRQRHSQLPEQSRRAAKNSS